MKNEIPTGIVIERGIARMVGFSAKFFPDMTASEAIHKPLITINSDTSARDADHSDGTKRHQEIAYC